MARWSLSAENGSCLDEEECFPHQQSLLSPSLKVGHGGTVAWWSIFFSFVFTCKVPDCIKGLLVPSLKLVAKFPLIWWEQAKRFKQ